MRSVSTLRTTNNDGLVKGSWFSIMVTSETNPSLYLVEGKSFRTMAARIDGVSLPKFNVMLTLPLSSTVPGNSCRAAIENRTTPREKTSHFVSFLGSRVLGLSGAAK
jgi:hypothetical protein